MIYFVVKEDTQDLLKVLKAVDKHPYMVLLGNEVKLLPPKSSKIELLVKNSIFDQKFNFWSKIELLVQN